MNPIRVLIPGQPVPQGRGRVGRWKAKDGRVGVTVRDPSKSANWKATAQQHMLVARGTEPVPTGPIAVHIVAVFARPMSEHRKREPMDREWHTRANGDADNLAKAVLDAGNGVLWMDDRQVSELLVRKVVAAQDEPPHVVVLVLDAPTEWMPLPNYSNRQGTSASIHREAP